MIVVPPSFKVENEGLLDRRLILQTIERLARRCYKSEGKITPDSYVEFVPRIFNTKKHRGIIEHWSITVSVICDRGVSHEWVRHRLASYLQESTRYCDYEAQDIAFVRPPGLDDPITYLIWKYGCKFSERIYKKLRSRGVKPEIARSVLLNGLKTEFGVTKNLGSWYHFFQLRTATAAHPQMRQITIPLLRKFQSILPEIFNTIEPGAEVPGLGVWPYPEEYEVPHITWVRRAA